jgi:hypothetical protein
MLDGLSTIASTQLVTSSLLQDSIAPGNSIESIEWVGKDDNAPAGSLVALKPAPAPNAETPKLAVAGLPSEANFAKASPFDAGMPCSGVSLHVIHVWFVVRISLLLLLNFDDRCSVAWQCVFSCGLAPGLPGIRPLLVHALRPLRASSLSFSRCYMRRHFPFHV